MKKLVVKVFIVVALFATAQAQNISADKVPSAVQSAFRSKFPDVKKVKWEIENETEYEASFQLNSKEQSVLFDASGNWLETEIEFSIAELPQAVNQALSKQFIGYKIKEAEKVEKNDGGNFFEVEIKKGNERLEVVLSPAGDILSKKTEDKDKDKD